MTVPSLGYSCMSSALLCDPGLTNRHPFAGVIFCIAVHDATMRSAGRNGKYHRSWCGGCREDPLPRSSGLLISIVCTDFTLGPQNARTYRTTSGSREYAKSSRSMWKCCSFVILSSPMAACAAPPPRARMSSTSRIIVMLSGMGRAPVQYCWKRSL